MAGKAAGVLAAVALLLLGLVGAGSGHASSVPVAPIVGPWEYSHVRCNNTIRGFTDEGAAQAHGITYHYNGCGDARLFEAGNWGTAEERTYGTCGSWNTYPRLLMGVETMNARRVRVQFCPQNYVDSFTLYRNRSVTCPPGYRAAGSVCTPIYEALNPDKNGGPECPSNGSNPINGATGNKYQRELDLATMPGGLEFVRHYNSYQVLQQGSREPGLPVNWRHNYSRNITWRAGSITTATLSRPEGRAWSFTLTEAGVWQADADVPGELQALRQEGDIVGWIYHGKDNVIEHYNSDGQLQRIVSPEGLSISLQHHDGRLAVVTDRHGHQLQFQYYPQGHDHAGLLAELVGPDNARWQYNYDAQANLTGVQYPGFSAQLSLRHYHYNEPAHTEDTDLPHALTGITLENGDRYGTYRYDAAGRAVSSEHGSMQANRTHISYHSDGSRTITDALGKQRQYNYVNRVGVARVTSISEPCSHCGGQSENRTYDSAGG
jgi:YD repeat-containing protein